MILLAPLLKTYHFIVTLPSMITTMGNVALQPISIKDSMAVTIDSKNYHKWYVLCNGILMFENTLFSLTFVMIVVCGTETSATICWSPDTVPVPCVSECGWGGCKGHAIRDRDLRRQFKCSNLFRLPVESAHSLFGHTVRGGESMLN